MRVFASCLVPSNPSLWTTKSLRSPKNTLSHLPPPYSPLPHLESSSCLSSGSLWSSTLSRHMKSGGTSCIWTLGAPVRHLTFSITVCLMWSRYCEIETNKKKLRRRIQLTTWIKPRSLRSPEMFELVEGIELGCLKKKTLLKQCYVVVNHFSRFSVVRTISRSFLIQPIFAPFVWKGSNRRHTNSSLPENLPLLWKLFVDSLATHSSVNNKFGDFTWLLKYVTKRKRTCKVCQACWAWGKKVLAHLAFFANFSNAVLIFHIAWFLELSIRSVYLA